MTSLLQETKRHEVYGRGQPFGHQAPKPSHPGGARCRPRGVLEASIPSLCLCVCAGTRRAGHRLTHSVHAAQQLPFLRDLKKPHRVRDTLPGCSDLTHSSSLLIRKRNEVPSLVRGSPRRLLWLGFPLGVDEESDFPGDILQQEKKAHSSGTTVCRAPLVQPAGAPEKRGPEHVLHIHRHSGQQRERQGPGARAFAPLWAPIPTPPFRSSGTLAAVLPAP